MDDNSSDSLASQSQSQIHATDVDEIPPSNAYACDFNSNAERKVLSNMDLLELIFSHFMEKSTQNLPSSDKLQSAPYRGRKHLLQVGLTCKAFFDPAMSQMWYEMHGFLPMLRLIAKVKLRGNVYTTKNVISQADIRRLQFYGRWIRHIQISSFTEKVSSHIYSAISRYINGKCLFPALKNLHIHSLSEIPQENLEILPLLASSPLSIIEIKQIKNDYRVHLSLFLHEISRLHSSENHPVSTLYLRGGFGLTVLPHLKGFAGISKLTLAHRAIHFYVQNLQYLTNLPLLSVLELELCLDEAHGIKPSPNNAVYSFQRIQTLALSGHAVHVLGILRYVYGESLARVTLDFFGLGPEAPTDVLRTCVERCTTMTPTLLHLQLTLSNTMLFPKDLFALLPGLQLHMRSLQIKSQLVDWPLFQALFRNAGVWSDLEVLKLELHATQSPTSSLHVADLVTLPVLCMTFPKLHTLDVYLCHPDADAAVIETLLRTQMETMNQTNHGLVNLKISFVDSSSSMTPFTIRDITLAITISQFIQHFFPNLQYLDMCHHHEATNLAWKDWYHAVVEMTKKHKVLPRAVAQ